MKAILEQLIVYYNGIPLRMGRDYKMLTNPRRIAFVKQFNRRYLRTRWEFIKEVKVEVSDGE